MNKLTDFKFSKAQILLTTLFLATNFTYFTMAPRILHIFHLYEPGGILIFDINTPYQFEKVLHANAAVYQTQNVFCVTEHTLDKKSKLFYLSFQFI